MARVTYYIKIGEVKYAWRAEEDKYKNIAKKCGIIKAKDKEANLVFGANQPKPPRLRLNFKKGIAGNLGADQGSQIIFCSAANLNACLGKGLAGLKSNGFTIDTTAIPG